MKFAANALSYGFSRETPMRLLIAIILALASNRK
jgi:hypothetical protein